jgi:hypothetical protein
VPDFTTSCDAARQMPAHHSLIGLIGLIGLIAYLIHHLEHQLLLCLTVARAAIDKIC